MTTAGRLVQIDEKSMGRCHLKSYRYTDDRNTDVVIKYIDEHNWNVRNFVEDFDNRVRQEISMRVPLQEYRREQNVNYYHYENIPYYFWQKMFDDTDKSRLAINSSPDGSLHEFRKEPGNDRLAIGNNEGVISALKEYIDSITEDTIQMLQQLREDRERIATRFAAFTSAIDAILGDVSWNKSIRGRCGWERGFFSPFTV